jgi:hypothetical protein
MNPLVMGSIVSAVIINLSITATMFFGWWALLINVFVVYSIYNNLRR